MNPIPTIETTRLRLRPFTVDDAPAVQRLAGDPQIADTTLLIPHPYPDLVAEAWIRTHAERYAAGEGAEFAIVERTTGALVGAIGLTLARRHDRAELGYWIGVPWWNRGYATEAVRATVRMAFDWLGLNRIEAQHFIRNPASGRVLQKAGLKREARLLAYVRKGDAYEDVESYVALKATWERAAAASTLGSGTRTFLKAAFGKR